MRWLWVVLLAVFAASICGCVTITVHSKVDKSGNIAEYNMTVVMPNFIGKKANMTNPKIDTTVKKLRQSGATVVEKTYTTNSSIVTVVDIKNLNLHKLNNSSKFRIRVVKEGNYIVYYDYTFTKNNTSSTPNEMLSSMIKVNYYLEMPGKIVDSNADKVKGNKAEWHFSTRKTPIYAKCEIPKSPGFEVFGAILAIALIAILKKKI